MKLQKTISSLLCICLLLSLCACATPAEQQPTYAVGVSLKTAGISIVPDNGGTLKENITAIAANAPRNHNQADETVYASIHVEEDYENQFIKFRPKALYTTGSNINSLPYHDVVVPHGDSVGTLIYMSWSENDEPVYDGPSAPIFTNVEEIRLGYFQAYAKSDLSAGHVIRLDFSCQQCVFADAVDAYNSTQTDDTQKLSPVVRTHSHDGAELLLTADTVKDSPFFMAETEEYVVLDLFYLPIYHPAFEELSRQEDSEPNTGHTGLFDHYENYVWLAMKYNLGESSIAGDADYYACLYTAIEARKFLQNGCSFVQQ